MKSFELLPTEERSYTVLQSIITPRRTMCDCIRWQMGKWKNIFCKANDAVDKCDESNE